MSVQFHAELQIVNRFQSCMIFSTLDPFRAPEPLPILNPSNFVPKNGFPVVKGLTPSRSSPKNVGKSLHAGFGSLAQTRGSPSSLSSPPSPRQHRGAFILIARRLLQPFLALSTRIERTVIAANEFHEVLSQKRWVQFYTGSRPLLELRELSHTEFKPCIAKIVGTRLNAGFRASHMQTGGNIGIMWRTHSSSSSNTRSVPPVATAAVATRVAATSVKFIQTRACFLPTTIKTPPITPFCFNHRFYSPAQLARTFTLSALLVQAVVAGGVFPSPRRYVRAFVLSSIHR